jgi:hypothetical protein
VIRAPSLRLLLMAGGAVGLAGPVLVVAIVTRLASFTLGLAAGLATGLVLVVVGVVLGWWLIRQIETVTAAAEQLAEPPNASSDGKGSGSGVVAASDLAVDVEMGRWPAELASLGQAVERLGDRLQAQTADHAEARAALADRARRLQAVQEVASEIVRELDLTRLLEKIVARAAQLVGASSGTISLWDPEQQALGV